MANADDVEKRTAARIFARSALWARGNLRFQLHATQLKILKALEAAKGRKFFLLCSRRLGKTFLLVNRAIQTCLQRPGARVLYLAPFAKDAQEISSDTAEKILEECPENLRPEWKGQAKEYVFKNGSIIRVKGVNGEHAQFLRGGAADLIILDECGLMDDLEHVIQDICMPMLMTTDGQLLMATTPPRSPGHESARQFEMLVGKEAACVFTLRDAPHVNDVTKIEYLMEAGESTDDATDCIYNNGWPKGTTARREYFCEFITDASSAVVPEFTKARELEIVKDWETPPYYDAYVSMDPGFRDRTGLLFAYWDFPKYKLIIQDERLLDSANTSEIAAAIFAKEKILWQGKRPMARISDVDLRLIADLHTMHRLSFSATRKEDSLGAVNLMRNMIQTEQIIINPRCTNLIRQLRNATWNHKATDFEHGSKDDGHYDLVAALKYLCRNVVKEHNPYPDWWTLPGGPGGPTKDSYVGHRFYNRRRTTRGLFTDTPVTRKLRGGK